MFSSMTHSSFSTCSADLNFNRHCFVTLKNVLNGSKAYAIPLSRLQLLSGGSSGLAFGQNSCLNEKEKL